MAVSEDAIVRVIQAHITLGKGPRRTSDIAREAMVSQSTVSSAHAVLKAEGLVSSSSAGGGRWSWVGSLSSRSCRTDFSVVRHMFRLRRIRTRGCYPWLVDLDLAVEGLSPLQRREHAEALRKAYAEL
jgi:hypothetical protein